MYQLRVEIRALKMIERLPATARQRIERVLSALRDTPRPTGCIKLHGHTYRIRVGSYRVIYDVDDESQQITVWRVAHRRDVYRDL